MAIQTLHPSELADWVEQNSHWSITNDGLGIRTTFEFEDFDAALAFMVAVAPTCDEMNHHPEWCNVYNRVDVTLTTHDAHGVTSRDLSLAQRMDEVGQGN